MSATVLCHPGTPVAAARSVCPPTQLPAGGPTLNQDLRKRKDVILEE